MQLGGKNTLNENPLAWLSRLFFTKVLDPHSGNLYEVHHHFSGLPRVITPHSATMLKKLKYVLKSLIMAVLPIHKCLYFVEVQSFTDDLSKLNGYNICLDKIKVMYMM